MRNLYTDGGCKGNGTKHQQATCALVDEDALIGTWKLGNFTNNEAEFLGVEKAFEYIKEKGIREPVVIWSDSRLVVNILNHSWEAHNPRIQKLANHLFKIVPPNAEVLWIPRDHNKAGQVLEFGIIQREESDK